MKSSLYLEFRPPRALSDRVMCFWTQQVDSAGGEYLHPVLPDGCVDIVWIGDAAPVVAGPATRRVIVGLPAGAALIGVRFRPGWAAASLGPPACELRDQDVPLSAIWRRAGALAEPGHGQRPAPARLRALAMDLAKRLSESPMPDAAVRASVAWLAQHPAGRIGDLAAMTGLGERRLHRRFREAVGYGPKQFQRIMRFQRLLLRAPACRELASAAADAGYADQAHMCREVKALAGEPPRRVLDRRAGTLSMSDLFNTADGASRYPKPSMTEWLRSNESADQHPYPGRR